MIINASEATPHNLEYFATLANKGNSVRAFTAKECAQIARAYLAAWREMNGKGSCHDIKNLNDWDLKLMELER